MSTKWRRHLSFQGVKYKITSWFTLYIGLAPQHNGTFSLHTAALKGILSSKKEVIHITYISHISAVTVNDVSLISTGLGDKKLPFLLESSRCKIAGRLISLIIDDVHT